MRTPAIIDDARLTKQSAAYNQEWLATLDLGDTGVRKVSQLHQDQLVHYLREVCVFDQVLTPSEITAADCEPGPETDTLYKRVYGQMELRSFMSSFESLPREVQEAYVKRIFLSFYMLSSPTVVLNDYNLLAYPFPVAKQIEDMIGPAMHEAIDWVMLDRLEATIQAARATYSNVIRGAQAQADIAANGLGTGDRFSIERDDIIALKKAFSNSRARIEKILMVDSDYIDFERLKLSDFGDDLVASVFRDGLNEERVHGVKIIRTIKSDFTKGDLIRPGNIYAFPAENMIGKSYVLQGLRFFLKRDHQFIEFDAQMARGFIWAVASRLFKVELYNGGLSLAGAVVGNYSGTEPGSDAIWGDPSNVTFKDYFNFDANLWTPQISFT